MIKDDVYSNRKHNLKVAKYFVIIFKRNIVHISNTFAMVRQRISLDFL